MLGLALVVSSLAGTLFLPADGAYTRCFHQEPGKPRIIDAALSECTVGEYRSRPEPARSTERGVFVADATGRVLGRNAGLVSGRVAWMSDGLLFVGSTKDAAEFTLLYLDDECAGQPYVEGAPYSNLAMPVQVPTGTWDAFVHDGSPRDVAPRSMWTGSACAKPCRTAEVCPASFPQRQARPVRSIGPYPTYTLPFSLVEK
jgi:hypothetical protein